MQNQKVKLVLKSENCSDQNVTFNSLLADTMNAPQTMLDNVNPLPWGFCLIKPLKFLDRFTVERFSKSLSVIWSYKRVENSILLNSKCQHQLDLPLQIQFPWFSAHKISRWRFSKDFIEDEMLLKTVFIVGYYYVLRIIVARSAEFINAINITWCGTSLYSD